MRRIWSVGLLTIVACARPHPTSTAPSVALDRPGRSGEPGHLEIVGGPEAPFRFARVARGGQLAAFTDDAVYLSERTAAGALTRLRLPPGHRFLDVGPSGDAAIVLEGGHVFWWDTLHNRSRRQLPLASAFTGAFSEDGRWVAVASCDGRRGSETRCGVWTVREDGAEEAFLEAPDDAVRDGAIAFSADGRYLALVSAQSRLIARFGESRWLLRRGGGRVDAQRDDELMDLTNDRLVVSRFGHIEVVDLASGATTAQYRYPSLDDDAPSYQHVLVPGADTVATFSPSSCTLHTWNWKRSEPPYETRLEGQLERPCARYRLAVDASRSVTLTSPKRQVRVDTEKRVFSVDRRDDGEPVYERGSTRLVRRVAGRAHACTMMHQGEQQDVPWPLCSEHRAVRGSVLLGEDRGRVAAIDLDRRRVLLHLGPAEYRISHAEPTVTGGTLGIRTWSTSMWMGDVPRGTSPPPPNALAASASLRVVRASNRADVRVERVDGSLVGAIRPSGTRIVRALAEDDWAVLASSPTDESDTWHMTICHAAAGCAADRSNAEPEALGDGYVVFRVQGDHVVERLATGYSLGLADRQCGRVLAVSAAAGGHVRLVCAPLRDTRPTALDVVDETGTRIRALDLAPAAPPRRALATGSSAIRMASAHGQVLVLTSERDGLSSLRLFDLDDRGRDAQVLASDAGAVLVHRDERLIKLGSPGELDTMVYCVRENTLAPPDTCAR